MPRLLNVGCGGRYCAGPQWTNVDFQGRPGFVLGHDLTTGIPFPDGTFDAVYHSNVLEHFCPTGGERLMAECCRVLKPHGVVRVAVPDLEEICRLYLGALDAAVRGDAALERRHRWMVIELLDQLARHRPGGEMGTYLRTPGVADRAFVIGRAGTVARALLPGEPRPQSLTPDARSPWVRRGWLLFLRRLLAARRWVLRLGMTSQERRAFTVGLFRLGGEPHLWMYDHFSLAEVMRGPGLVSLRKCGPNESRIENWPSYNLDADADGCEHQPASLYMEGLRGV